jgi:acetylornithine aminotransferase
MIAKFDRISLKKQGFKMTLKEIDEKYVLHTYKRNYVNITHGSGSKLFDDKGNDYIDFASGIAVSSVGHANPRLVKVISEQAAKILHISNLFLIEPQAKLAKRVVELSKIDAVCFFCNSGAEANEAAIKMARKFGSDEDGSVKKHKVITLDQSFHGRTITTLKATAQDKFHNYFGPYTDSFIYASSIAEIPSLVDDETAAVLIEFVQGEGGVHEFDVKEIQNLAKILKEKGVLLIADEIQTGVYRTGEFLASQRFEIEPDITTLAKGLGGGVPIGCVITKLKDIFNPGDHGTTFGGNYLATSAALEVLDILEEERTSGKLWDGIKYFCDKLCALQAANPTIFLKATGLGYLRGLKTPNDETMAKIIEAAFESGVILLKAGRSTVRFAPPLVITKEEIDLGFERLTKAIANI